MVFHGLTNNLKKALMLSLAAQVYHLWASRWLQQHGQVAANVMPIAGHLVNRLIWPASVAYVDAREHLCSTLWTRRLPCAKCPAVVRAQIRQDGTHQALIDHTHTKHEAWQGVNCHFLSSFPTAGLWVQTQRKDSIFRSGFVSVQPWKGS